jgi:hypothetical protein
LVIRTVVFAFLAAALVRDPSAQEGHGPTRQDPGDPYSRLPLLAAGEILVVGETHGSNEIPAYFLEMVRHEARNGRVTVGLELPASAAGIDCRSHAPRRLPAGWRAPNQDGRTSRAMRTLICGLRDRSLSRQVRIVFLDNSVRGANFDEEAARRFRQAFARQPRTGLILTGNYHSRNNEGSLAAHLRRLGSSVRTATVSSASAETWICSGEPISCGARPSNINFCSRDPAAAEAIRWHPVADPRFAWNLCLSLPRLTASPPAALGEPAA